MSMIKEKIFNSLKVLFKNITAGFDSKYGKFWMYQKFLKDPCQKKPRPFPFQNQQVSKYFSMHVLKYFPFVSIFMSFYVLE